MDEADFELLRKLILEIDQSRDENWIDLHNFREQKFGKRIHIDCHVTLPYYLTALEAYEEIDRMEDLIKEYHKKSVEMFIHTELFIHASYRIC